jgi:DHA1 family bicyclomycin/chloramphenicol resistance-like MFS transporter
VRFAPRHSLEKLIWFGLALQFWAALMNLRGDRRLNQRRHAVRHPDAGDVRQRLRDVERVRRAISVRPEPPAPHRARWFSADGDRSLFSQFGAWLGGDFATPCRSISPSSFWSMACASTMIFLVPRRDVVIS